MTIVCDDCHQGFEDVSTFKAHPCPPPPQPAEGGELVTPAPALGNLGQSVESFEERRIDAVDLRDIPGIKSAGEIATLDAGLKLSVMIKPVMAEMTRQLEGAVDNLRRDISESASMMKHLDVPLEQVANSHERAASSFETLRKEIRAVAARQEETQRIIDTAGLTDAVNGTERRIAALVDRLDEAIGETSRNMVQILKLLQALQDRDLSHTRQRINSAARRAVKRARS